MTRQSYQKVVREFRHFADLIEANLERKTPRQKQLLTQALTNARRCADRAEARHCGRQTIAEQLFAYHAREGREQHEADNYDADVAMDEDRRDD